MKVDWSFVRLVIFCFAGAAVLTYYPISGFVTAEVVRGIIAGGIMSFINLVLGYVAIEFSYERSHTTFLKYVLGGMVARLMLMSGVLLVLVKLCQCPFRFVDVVIAFFLCYEFSSGDFLSPEKSNVKKIG